jgi:hypothetical protein
MLDDVKRAELDQSMAMLKEIYPGLMWTMFTEYKERGFTEDQAFELVKTHILGLAKGY